MLNKILIFVALLLMVLPLVSADIIDHTIPSVHSKIVNMKDFPNHAFVMVYEAPHESRGPSFVKQIYQEGDIPTTTRYGDAASLYALKNSKFESEYFQNILYRIYESKSYDSDELTEQAKEYLQREGVLVIKHLTVSSDGYLGIVEVEYTLKSLDTGNYTLIKDGVDVTPVYDLKTNKTRDSEDNKYEPISPQELYLIGSLIALLVIIYLVHKKRISKQKKKRKK